MNCNYYGSIPSDAQWRMDNRQQGARIVNGDSPLNYNLFVYYRMDFLLKNAKHRNYSTDFLFVQLAFGKEKDCGMGALGI
jgi:hypothetical protein